jgi:hypothetical protein
VGCFADPSFPPPLTRHPWVNLPPGVEVHEGSPVTAGGAPPISRSAPRG